MKRLLASSLGVLSLGFVWVACETPTSASPDKRTGKPAAVASVSYGTLAIANGDTVHALSAVLGSHSTTTFQISNTGNADMTDIAVSVSGTDAADFAVTSPPAAAVAAGASTDFGLTFTPSSVAVKTVTVQVATSVATVSFLVSAEGSAVPLVPAMTLDAAAIVFATPDLSQTLVPTVTDTTPGTYTWVSSDKSVAAVSSSGLVTGISGGTATITATMTGTVTLTATCAVTVDEPNRTIASSFIDPTSITSGPVTIIMCGDSTMRTYTPSASDQAGWGQVLDDFFTSDVAVNNAISNGGRSSRSFYNERNGYVTPVGQTYTADRWVAVKALLAASVVPTYVFIQFGHNDQKKITDSFGGDYLTFARYNQNGTTAGTYYDYLERYIVEARELGGIPVLFTPFVRSYLEGVVVTARGQHNITDLYAGETRARGDYVAAMKAVGAKHNVPVIDLTAASKAFVEAYSAAGALNHLYISGDQTHERTVGALLLAQAAADGLRNAGILTNHLLPSVPSRLLMDTATLSFGSLTAGATKDMSFLLSSFGDASGTVTITTPDGFTVSTDGGTTFSTSATLDCTAGWKGSLILVRFAPTASISYAGTLQVSHTSLTPSYGTTPGNATAGTINLTGLGKAVVAGAAASVSWPMVVSGAVNYDGVIEGGVSSTTASFAGLGFKSMVTLADTTSVPRFTTADAGVVTGNWPAETSRNAARYVQFSVPVSSGTFVLNTIALEAASGGGSTVKWDIVYSTTADFSVPVELAVGQTGANGVMVSFTSPSIGLSVSAGNSLYLRVYPYNSAAASGKYLYLRNVVIAGVTN